VQEIGTHNELMALNGLYHSLVTTQSGGTDAETAEEQAEVEDTVEAINFCESKPLEMFY